MVNVCIVGLGLMGGSLGMALRRLRKNGRRLYDVAGLGRSRRRLQLAKKRGAVDRISTQPEHVIPKADVIVLASPVSAMPTLTKKIRPHLQPGAVLTDVGSVKGRIAHVIERNLRGRSDVHFVGAHPLAGSEKTGVGNADKDLYRGTICVVASNKTAPRAVRVIKEMWHHVGARTVEVSAKDHDRILAMTSHLPHLLAFSLFSLVFSASKKEDLIKTLIAGSFRDMTRIAGSDADLWTGIIDFNRRDIKKSWEKFSREVKNLLRQSPRKLRSHLAALSFAKHQWIKN